MLARDATLGADPGLADRNPPPIRSEAILATRVLQRDERRERHAGEKKL
jgi:hypothetical protein